MRRLFTVLFMCLALNLGASAATQRLVCFQRGNEIWVAQTDGSHLHKVGRGTSPEISPDGAQIAFHMESADSKNLERRVATLDLSTGKATVFTDQIPSDNCQSVIWSPDGNHLLFSIFTESDWHLALVNADGNDFRYLKKATPKNSSLWSACWAPDGQSIYAQDLNTLYQLGLNGSVIKRWSLETLFPKGSFSSASRLAMSPDGETLLAAVEMEEATENDNGDPMLSTLWSVNLATGKVARLTPKGMYAADGCWLNAEEILFVSQGAKDKNPSIYQMTSQGKDRKLFLKNGQTPSISAGIKVGNF